MTYGFTIDGVDIDIIDMHLHTGTWEALTEPYKERYSERVPKPFKFLMEEPSWKWFNIRRNSKTNG